MAPRQKMRQRAAALTTKTVQPARRDRLRQSSEAETNNHILALKAYTGTKQIADNFSTFLATGGVNLTVITPSYNLNSLVKLPKESEILGQCISAMVTNVVGHGWSLQYVGPDGKEKSPEAQAEKTTLESLLNFPNEEYTLSDLLERVKTDKETIGQGFIEAIRDQKGRVTVLSHIPGHTMRLTEKEYDPVEVEVQLVRDGAVVKQKVWRYFRRFVQRLGVRTVYFKEFGDPRRIDPKTGRENDALSPEDAATEVIMDAIYAPGEAYGMPRWLGALPNVIGNRQADLTNLDYFKNNGIPALAVLVSGGQLINESVQELEQILTGVRGRDAQNRVVVLEAEGFSNAASSQGALPPPRVEIKPLAGERQTDAHFLELKKDGQNTVRSTFRLAPIFTGHSSDYTLATAKTSFEVAESQVFGPERAKTEAMMQLRVLGSYLARYWAFKLQPARITDPEEVVKALTAFDNMGAITPNLSIAMANAYFDLDIPTIEEEWGNWPFAIVKDLAVKGQLVGIEAIADFPEPPEVVVSPPGAEGGEPDPQVPTETGEGGKAKPSEAPEQKRARMDRKKATVMQGVRRQLMEIRSIARELKDAA